MKHKNFGPERKTRVSGSNSSFGSKAKTSQFFELFINFLVVCHLILNIQKQLLRPFSVLARYGPFDCGHGQKMKIWKFFLRHK